eukprot:g38721.t1
MEIRRPEHEGIIKPVQFAEWAALVVPIEKLRASFTVHGLPEVLVTYNRMSFTSREVKYFLKSNGFQHIKTAPYHPLSNGLVERVVQTLRADLKKQPTVSLDTNLSWFLFGYRTSPHTTTGIAPAELLVGRRLCTRLNLLLPDLSGRVKRQQEHPRWPQYSSWLGRQFNSGDEVWCQTMEMALYGYEDVGITGQFNIYCSSLIAQRAAQESTTSRESHGKMRHNYVNTKDDLSFLKYSEK